MQIQIIWRGEADGVVLSGACPHKTTDAFRKRYPHLEGVEGDGPYNGPVSTGLALKQPQMALSKKGR